MVMVVDDSNTLQHEAEAEADTGMMRLLLLRRCGERNVEDDEEVEVEEEEEVTEVEGGGVMIGWSNRCGLEVTCTRL